MMRDNFRKDTKTFFFLYPCICICFSGVNLTGLVKTSILCIARFAVLHSCSRYLHYTGRRRGYCDHFVTVCECGYVGVYVSTIKRKPLIAMIWNHSSLRFAMSSMCVQ